MLGHWSLARVENISKALGSTLFIDLFSALRRNALGAYRVSWQGLGLCHRRAIFKGVLASIRAGHRVSES